MTKELEIITEYIEKIEEYEKKTGKQYPAIYITKELCVAIKEKLQKLESIDNSSSSEALECLERMFGYASLDEHDFEEASDDYNTIKQALLELKAIKEAIPSEALIDLEKIKIGFGCDMAYYDLNVEYENVKQALLKAKEQEKVLEIIKKKEVNIGLFILCDSVKEYNKNYKGVRSLTQEEFDLLKRYFNE